MSVIFAAIPAVIYLSAGLPATAGTMTIGTLIAFTALQSQLFRPLMGLLNTGVQVVSSLALFQRVFEYLDLTGRGRRARRPGRGRSVSRSAATSASRASASPTRGPTYAALDGVDLDVPAGTTTALVGETGSGKTTLASLVARLFDPTEGRVTIDGVDVRRLRLADLAEIVGVVSQETYLLHATVRENLRYARPEATDAEIEEAARAAHIHDLLALAARGLRHRGRLARTPLLRRREAASRDRPHPAAQPADPGARRGHQRARHRDRARRPAGLRHPRARAVRRSPSRTGSRPSATPTRSSSSDHGRVRRAGHARRRSWLDEGQVRRARCLNVSADEAVGLSPGPQRPAASATQVANVVPSSARSTVRTPRGRR